MPETSLKRSPAPIALFAYRRLGHLERTVEALKANELASESDLFIFSDGPRSSVDKAGVDGVRNYIAGIGGFRSVQTVFHATNLGLSRSIIQGVTDIINARGRLIVLEDDIVTSRHFLKYMNDALDLYADAACVASVHGYVYPLQEFLPDTFFLKGADCWGWGTWKRAWDLFEVDGSKLLKELTKRRLQREFDYGGVANYTRMLKLQIDGLNDSWAVRWYASAFLRDMLTLYPGRSLVRNIGNDSSGQHCGTTDVYDVGDVSDSGLAVNMQPLEECRAARIAFARYFRSLERDTFLRSIMRWFKYL
ncbi:MAG: hypothetical protein QM790_02480 [Nibricoccus sp.]